MYNKKQKTSTREKASCQEQGWKRFIIAQKRNTRLCTKNLMIRLGTIRVYVWANQSTFLRDKLYVGYMLAEN